MGSKAGSKNLIDKAAFGGFLILVASLAVQKPSIITVGRQNLVAADLVFPFAAILAALAFVAGRRRLVYDRAYFFLGLYIAAFAVATIFSSNFFPSALKTFATLYLVCMAALTAYLVDSTSRLK